MREKLSWESFIYYTVYTMLFSYKQACVITITRLTELTIMIG